MTQIIAEIGWNHMGDMNLAQKMIEAAAMAGAHYVKFQTWSVNKLKSGPWDSDGRRQIYEKAELSYEKHLLLKQTCEKNQVKFLTSCFSADSVAMVSELIDEVKIPSTEVNNLPLLQRVNEKFKRVFLSTGSSTFDEVKAAVNVFRNCELVLMHCVSSYPCPYEATNLGRINELRNLTKRVGYSGHCEGVYDAIASFNYDVEVIEKHFTIDKSLPGRDNKFALLPDELAMICNYAKVFPAMNQYLGTDFQECEKDQRSHYRGRWDRTV